MFDYMPVAGWPELAWLSYAEVGSREIKVFHGTAVETHDEWFCEAVWSGDFERGDFDRTDLVFGSGCRWREEGAIFVSSGTTLDRLCWWPQDHGTWISNSLCCLLAAIDAELDPAYPHYFYDQRSIMYRGLAAYRPTLNTSRGPVRFTFFHNLRWDGHTMATYEKLDERKWPDFAAYRGFLHSGMEGIVANAGASGRRRNYHLLSTLSRGYDSGMVTAIARNHGCKEVICFTRSRDGRDDSGESLARYLGVRPWAFDRMAWQREPICEPLFMAGDGVGTEVYLKAAEPLLHKRVLLTGYFGDQMWSKTPRTIEPIFLTGGNLSLSEYRLAVGFFNCPLAYWGGRQLSQTVAISRSEEMRPWDVSSPYSRPICRRIVEEAGVPRELFGQRKMMVSVLTQVNEFLGPESCRDYLEWLGSRRDAWLRRRQLPPWRSLRADSVLRSVLNAIWVAMGKAGLSEVSRKLLSPVYLRRYLFPWAVDRVKNHYYSAAVGLARP